MTRKTAKRAGIFLAIVLMVGLVLGALKTAHAEPTNLVTHDGDEIRAALQSDGDVNITLDGNVNWTVSRLGHGVTTWATLGSGSKTLDLAGHKMDISVEDVQRVSKPVEWVSGYVSDIVAEQLYLFEISYGASFTVNDSSGANKGVIIFNGYIHDATSGAAGTHMSDYENWDVIHRNIFNVTGGDLTFNGGKIETRRKEQYVSPARPWDKLTGASISKDVSQQINCVPITMSDGNVTINGGYLMARGFRYMYTCRIEGGGYYYSKYDRAAVVVASGGNLVINNGTLQGRGCADVLQVSGVKSLTIRGGEFKTHKVDYVLVPGYADGGSTTATGCPRYMSGSYGRIGIPVSALDSAAVTVSHDGSEIAPSDWSNDTIYTTSHDLVIAPRDDLSAELYNETYADTVGDTVVWDGKTDVVLTADLTPYWPTEEIPLKKTPDNGTPIRYFAALAQSSKDLGVTAGVSIGGMTVSDGGEQVQIEKRIGSSMLLDIDNLKLTLHLKDVAPDGVKIGDSFLVTVQWADILYNSTNDPSTNKTFRVRFSVSLQENDLEILQNPQSASVTTSGKSVTLTAQAANASDAYWLCVYPSDRVLVEGSTFDKSTGVSTIDVTVTKYAEYICCFKNFMGTLETTKAAVSILPTLTGDREVQWSKKVDTVYLSASGPSSATAGKIDQRWYWRASETDEWTQIEKVAGKIDPSTYDATLCVKNPDDEYAGYYYMEADYHTGEDTVTTVKSGVIHVTVIEGLTAKTVETSSTSPLRIYGMPEMYKGDVAPTSEEMVAMLYTDDERVAITQFNWEPEDLTADRRFNTTAPRFTMMLVARQSVDTGYRLYVDDWGRFYVNIDGVDYAAVGTATAETVMGVTVNKKNVQGIYTAPADWYVPQVLDTIEVQQVYTLTPGQEVDIQLDPTVICHERHQEAGITHDTVEKYELFDNGDPSTYRLPAGLILSADGRITGTVEEEVSETPVKAYVNMYIKDYDGYPWAIPLNFYIVPEITSMDLPDLKMLVFHAHTFGEWTDTGDGETHVHVCDACGNEEASPHHWDDGVVVTPATGTAKGMMAYTCEDCGAIKREEIEPHTIVKVDEVPSTCIEQGTIEHYECEDCGKPFEDAEGTVLIEDASTLLLPLGDHTWGEWELVKEATPSADGEEKRVCSVCGEEETRPVKYNTVYFSVSFDLNGGTLDGKTGTVTMEIEKGTTITLPAPTREGYTFDYWKGSRYAAGDSYVVEDDHTFTAQWKENGGSGGNGDSGGNAPGAPSDNGNNKPADGSRNALPGAGDPTPVGLCAALTVTSLVGMLANFVIRRACRE